MRPIIPTTTDKLPGLIQLTSGLNGDHDYYLKDLTSLEQWADLARLRIPLELQTARVWCPLNSFNIPSSLSRPGSFLCLQGAGDLFMCTAFFHALHPVSVYTYTKYADILELNPFVSEIVRIDPGKPHDLDYAMLQRRCEYTVGFPLAVRAMWMEAVKQGWDHYAWKRLLLGTPWLPLGVLDMVPPDADYDRIRPLLPDWSSNQKTIASQAACPVILHLTASSRHRSAFFLLDPLLEQVPYAKFILLGGSELSDFPSSKRVVNLAGRLTYRETYQLLLDYGVIVIAVDSVVLHMANACGVSHVLGLYGYTPDTWRGPHSGGMETVCAKGIDKIDPRDVVRWLKGKLTGTVVTWRGL